MEPLFRELHRVFPDSEIVTTFQMTDEFEKSESIRVLPLKFYYEWNDQDLVAAEREYRLASKQNEDCVSPDKSDYIDLLGTVDLVVNVSGDMWGDNAEQVGANRFLVDLYKMRTAQLMGIKTVLFAVTPGPFSDDKTKEFAKEVFAGFDLVICRESNSEYNIREWGFPTDNIMTYPCPSFLFQAAPKKYAKDILKENCEYIDTLGKRPLCGFTIGGLNMPTPPYDAWPRENRQYKVFADCVEQLLNITGGKVMLISHTNGFHQPPDFKLINGRDYPILEQLQHILAERGVGDDVFLIQDPHLPATTKALIGLCDLFVAGRVHASVAAISQFVPTVFIEYDSNVIWSKKMLGFSSLVGMQDYVGNPSDKLALSQTIAKCWSEREEVGAALKTRLPDVQRRARQAFDELALLMK
jgi:colanic acid/amylovoran biosynthesis protein